MAIQERVTSYTVAHLRNEFVGFRQVIRLVTDTGHRAFIAFIDPPPPQWLTVTGNTSTLFLPTVEFDRLHHTLQSESPVFYTAFALFGPAFNLGTGLEAPGEGPGDPDALAAFMARARQQAATAGATALDDV